MNIQELLKKVPKRPWGLHLISPPKGDLDYWNLMVDGKSICYMPVNRDLPPDEQDEVAYIVRLIRHDVNNFEMVLDEAKAMQSCLGCIVDELKQGYSIDPSDLEWVENYKIRGAKTIRKAEEVKT